LDIKKKASSSSGLNEANTRIENLKDTQDIKRTSVINLNEFIQTSKQPAAGKDVLQIRIIKPNKTDHPSGSSANHKKSAQHMTHENRKEVGSVESDVISVVEVIELDPKISNGSKKYIQQKPTLHTMNPIGNSDLDVIINSNVKLPKLRNLRDPRDSQKSFATNKNQRSLKLLGTN